MSAISVYRDHLQRHLRLGVLFVNLVLFIACIFALPLAAQPEASAATATVAPMKTVQSGATWVVEQTTRLSRLAIRNNAQVVAPDGLSLTMTVGGVGMPIGPGIYVGDVVLTVTKGISTGSPGQTSTKLKSAIYIDSGAYAADKSVPSMIKGGKVTNTEASDFSLTSREEKFNGIVVTGNSDYTINNAKIDLRGAGGNDSAGWGAAVMANSTAKLTINKSNIVTEGPVRNAVFIGGSSTVTVNDSYLEANTGVLPADYHFTIAGSLMKEVPYGLGIHGTVRATNLVDKGTVYYNNDHIKAQAWGALSSDGGQATRMFVTNCKVEVVESGYGAYALGEAIDTFRHSTFDVPDYGLIIGGNGTATFTDGSVVNSRRFGVMMHQGTGGSTLTVEKGSVINSKLTSIEVKGRGTKIVIDNAELHPANGVILQTMENDDPIMAAMGKGGSGAPEGDEDADPTHANAPPAAGAGPAPGAGSAGAPAGGLGGPSGTPSGAPGGAPGSGPGGGSRGAAPTGGGSGVPGSGSSGFSKDVEALVKNVKLAGDMIHGMPNVGNMSISLENATLTGAITSATTAPASGKVPTWETYYTIGEVTNTFGATTGKFGVKVDLDGKSNWLVNKTSYINSLKLAAGAKVVAPANSKVTMLVNGVATPIKAGIFEGAIVLQVSAL